MAITRLLTFAERVRFHRKEHNFTQKQLGRVVGVSESHIRKWEGGCSFASADKLVELAHSLDITTDYLLGLTDEPHTKKSPEKADYIDLSTVPTREVLTELERRCDK